MNPLRSHTPPLSTTSQASSPAYHSSAGDSESLDGSVALDDSWYPVASPASPAHSLTNSASDHYPSDNDTLSSSIYSAGSLTDDSVDGAEHDHHDRIVDGSGSMLDDYVDAESPGTDLSESSSTLAPSMSASQVPLIYPLYDDLENSFASSTTASDGTTPNASVGELLTAPIAGPMGRAQRLSSHQLERLAGAGKGEKKVERVYAHPAFLGSNRYQALASAENIPVVSETEKQMEVDDKEVPLAKDDAPLTAQEIRQAVKAERLRRALATANMAGIRGAGQRWSLKMSIFTLASLLGLVLATVRYSTTPTSDTVTEPVAPPVQTGKPFSIMDYLPASSSFSNPLFDSAPAPSSIMPDVRLIKNALSLSTKAVPLLPDAKVDAQPKVPKVKAGVTGEASTSYAVALRNTEAGLMAFVQGSTWPLNRKVAKKPKPSDTPINSNETYGQMIISDIKAAWARTRTLSSYSHAEFIHYIRDQILATIQLEIQQALILARYVIQLSKNVTQSASQHLQRGNKHAIDMYEHLRAYTTSINVTATTETATNHAKSGMEAVTSKAIMTSQKGKEAIQHARAGLDYLVAEAKRMRGETVETKEKTEPVRIRSFKDKIKSHRGKLRWRMPDHGKRQVPTQPLLARETSMSLKQKLMQALHNAAMPLVV